MWAAGRKRKEVLAAMRRRKHRRFMNRYGRYMAAGALLVTVAAVMLWAAVALAGSGAGESRGGKQGTARAQEIRQEVTVRKMAAAAEAEKPGGEEYPFNTMSQDWAGEDLQGFKLYQIPQEYEREGGTFPEVMQKYTYIVCGQAGVDYAVTLALIEVESGYKWDAGGMNDDVGYMQIVKRWHEDRMERLNAGDLLNPFHNVSVGVDYLAEMLEKYGGSYEKALTAYQYGASGAYQCFFSCGEDKSPYAGEVLEVAERIKKEMAKEE